MCHLGEHMGLGLRSTLTKKKRILQTKKSVEKLQGKTVGLVVCAFTVCLENEIGWI